MKKIVCFGIAVLLVFSLSACGGEALAEYKAEKISELETYAKKQEKDNYPEENWTRIEKVVSDGKEEISAAKKALNVDTAFDSAKLTIDEILPKEEIRIERAAKQSFLDLYIKPKYPNATVDDIVFRKFLGIYDGSLVAIFEYNNKEYKAPEYFYATQIEEYLFLESTRYPILVWNAGYFYSLHMAYGVGENLLTEENIASISELNKKK